MFFVFAGAGKKDLHHRLAGNVAGVQDAPVGMPAFLAKVIFVFLALALAALKLDAKLFKLDDACTASVYDLVYDLWIAQPAARRERIFHMRFDRIIGVDNTGDAALGIEAVAFGCIFLAGHQYAPMLAELHGGG